MSDEFLPFEDMQRGVYRLLTLAYSRQPAVDAYTAILGAKHPGFTWMIQKLEAEFESTLLSVAILIRAHDNRFAWTKAYQEAARESGLVPDAFSFCGFLLENGKRKPLGLREACNRIIHGSWIYVDYENITTVSEVLFRKPARDEETVLYPSLVVKQSPKLSKTPWRAEIDIFRFIQTAEQLTCEEDDDNAFHLA